MKKLTSKLGNLIQGTQLSSEGDRSGTDNRTAEAMPLTTTQHRHYYYSNKNSGSPFLGQLREVQIR